MDGRWRKEGLDGAEAVGFVEVADVGGVVAEVVTAFVEGVGAVGGEGGAVGGDAFAATGGVFESEEAAAEVAEGVHGGGHDGGFAGELEEGALGGFPMEAASGVLDIPGGAVIEEVPLVVFGEGGAAGAGIDEAAGGGAVGGAFDGPAGLGATDEEEIASGDGEGGGGGGEVEAFGVSGLISEAVAEAEEHVAAVEFDVGEDGLGPGDFVVVGGEGGEGGGVGGPSAPVGEAVGVVGGADEGLAGVVEGEGEFKGEGG